MTYFNSRELAAVSLFAGLWGVLNGIFAPIVFQTFGLPIFCDMIGFTALSLAFWWTRKFGAVTAVGLIATALNFIFNPRGFQFLGFTVASFAFDVVGNLVGHRRIFKQRFIAAISIVTISTVSATIAGFIIGSFFLAAPILARWGGTISWAALHAAGGLVGGLIGVTLITGLTLREVRNLSPNI